MDDPRHHRVGDEVTMQVLSSSCGPDIESCVCEAGRSCVIICSGGVFSDRVNRPTIMLERAVVLMLMH